MLINHLRNRVVEVWRPSLTEDGMGGQEETMVKVADVKMRISLPSFGEGQEEKVGQRWEIHATHNAFMNTGEDVQRNDEFRWQGEVYRVLATTLPSRPPGPSYLKAQLQRIDTETQAGA